jgi:multidrug resistance efflux pump
MSNLKPNVPEYKKHHPVFRHLMGGWSFLVWLAMIGVTYLSYLNGGAFLPLNGQVQVIKENVATLETARIAKLMVSPGQVVKSGDVIAVLDTSLIDLRIEEIKVRLRRERQEEALNALDRQRRLVTEAQELRKTISETEMLLYSDKSSQAALADRYKALTGFLKKGLVSDTEYVKVGVDLAALEPKINKYPELIEQYKQDLATVLRLQQATEAAGLALHTDQAGEPLEASLDKDPQLKELLGMKDNHTLRAASDGMVWNINFQVGEVVTAGTPVAVIIKNTEPVIESFVPETLMIHVVVGQELRISTLTAPDQYYRAKITAITPQIVGQTDKANSMAKLVIRGRHLLLTPAVTTPLLPGESVIIEQIPKPWF